MQEDGTGGDYLAAKGTKSKAEVTSTCAIDREAKLTLHETEGSHAASRSSANGNESWGRSIMRSILLCAFG